MQEIKAAIKREQTKARFQFAEREQARNEVSTLQSNNKTTKYMNNMKKMLADQQRINEAVKAIVEYFTVCYPYEEHLEQMVDAQTEIVALMELAKQQAAIGGSRCEVDTETITVFLQAVRTYLKLLKPFATASNE